MESIKGKKRAGDHSTLIDVAAKFIPLISKLQLVKSISPGHISTGPRSSGGRHGVKICIEPRDILLVFRQASSVQDVRIYSEDVKSAALAIARLARDNQLPISFKKKS